MGIAPIPAAPARKEAIDDLPAPAIPGSGPAPAAAPLAAANPRAVKSQADLPPPPPIPAELSAPPAPAIADRGAASVTIASTRPPASEPPRGIVAPYQPKDDPSGPAVVLKEDVLAMEEAQAATEELLREHAVSSRRAPTIMNLKPPSVSAYPAPDFAVKRSRGPFLIGGVVLALGAALIVVVVFAFKGKSADVPAAAPVSQVAPAVTSPVAPTATLEVPPPLPPEAPTEAPAARESDAEPRAAAVDTKPPVKKSAPKAPSKAFAKPASGTTAPAPKKSGVIVRDTPF